MILFLDFDGVLHPQYEDQPVPADVAFCHLPQFEAVIREFPAVEIVISSTWREQFSLANLRSRFSPDIASRIIGTTLLAKDQVTPRLVERREWEIVTWLTVQGRSNEPWIALDDATPENGCLRLAPGSHKQIFTERQIEDGKGFNHRLTDEDMTGISVVNAPVPRGGAVFFHDLTLHGSCPNVNGQDRWSVIPTYRNAAEQDESTVWKQSLLLISNDSF